RAEAVRAARRHADRPRAGVPDPREDARRRQLAAGQRPRAVRPQPEPQQPRAIRYLGIMGGAENRQVLADVYRGSSDVALKRSILRSFMVAGDRERLL